MIFYALYHTTANFRHLFFTIYSYVFSDILVDMKKTIYFDNAASTMVRDEVIQVMLRVMKEDYGNPHSMHEQGRKASRVLDCARKNIADALGVSPKNLLFTSGGTEANNLATLGVIPKLSFRGKHIITSKIEHSAVLEPIKSLEASGWEVSYLSPNEKGVISAESFASALRDDTVFASIMLVNNEVGSLNPINKYAAEIKKRGLNTILHTDAVQGLCKIAFTASTLGADLIAVSSHKLHGPTGAGALFVSDKAKLSPLLLGGPHEGGKRAGTEALLAIAGFGEAVRLASSELSETSLKVSNLRKLAVDLLTKKLPNAVFLGNNGSPFLLTLSLPGFKGEVLMNYLDGNGICVSRGAACKKGARSRILEAMGLNNDIIDGALRVSFSKYSTSDEVKCFVDTLVIASKALIR